MKKVLIICAGLQFGGVERFAANIIKFAPADEFQFDYLTFEGLGDAFAPEIIERGGRVITIPSPQRGYRNYIRKLGELMDENRYDVVHSHTQFNSGINLWVAKKHRVPVRIAHSHTTAHENAISLQQRLYEKAMRQLIRTSATHCCSCGVEAGKWMYGNHPFTVISNGIDTDAFAYNERYRSTIREQYHIAPDAFVIGHSGTIYPLKNQAFLIRLLPAIRTIKENAELVLVGTGSEEHRNELQQLVKELGLEKWVHFTGAVLNVNEYYSAFDVFAFPSLREGTPLALLEAQANGLPCIISTAIPEDAQITDLVKALPLNKKPWVDSISSAQRNNSKSYAQKVSNLGYGIYSALEPLYGIYRGAK